MATPTAECGYLLNRLATRFAHGEIDEAEFNRRTHALTYGPPLELGTSE